MASAKLVEDLLFLEHVVSCPMRLISVVLLVHRAGISRTRQCSNGARPVEVQHMGNALTAPFLATLLALGPAAPVGVSSPRAAPTERPLRQIGHVHATTTFCKAVLERTSTAITILLDNDRKIAETETFLRGVELDTSELSRTKGSQALNQRYIALRAAAIDGNKLMKEARTQVKAAPTAEQRTDMGLFVDALDGALNRQRRLADDVGKIVVYIDNHPRIDKDTHDQLQFEAIESQSQFAVNRPAQGAVASVPDSLSTTAHEGAGELVQRGAPISTDEDDAAARIEPAFSGC